MIGRTEPIGATLGLPLLVLVFGFASAAMAITLFVGERHLLLNLFGGLLVLVLFIASSEQRLFCLWGLALTAPLSLAKVYMPFPHMGGAAAYTIDVSDIFLVPLVLCTLRDGFARRGPLRLSPYTFWAGALILLGVSDVVFGDMRQISAEEELRLIKCLLIFFVVINQGVSSRQLLHIAAALLVGVGVEGIIALLQFATKSNLHLEGLGAPPDLEIRAEAAIGMFRVGGLLIHANLLGAYLALLMPIGIALLFSRIQILYKFAITATLGLGVLALVLTLSRSSWLSFSVAFIALMALSFVNPQSRRRFLLGRLLAIAAVVAAGLLLSTLIGQRLLGNDLGSVDFRWEWLGVAWRMILERPFFGWGLNTFIYHLPGQTRFGGVRGLNDAFGVAWPIVHNIYFIIWSEQGTIGFVFFIMLNVYLLRVGFRNVIRVTDDRLAAINLGCLCGLLAILTDGLSSFFTRVPPGGRVFAIVAGLIVAIDYWNRANSRQPATATAPTGSRFALQPATGD
jgi:putative inorganic carbon (hco3(-)) transporter